MLKIGDYDSPNYGRRYEVFCGPRKLGTLEIKAAYKYETEKIVRASIKLIWVRLLSFEILAGFLRAIATHIDSEKNNGEENRTRIHSAITRSLWNSLNISDDDSDLDWGELEATLEGNADFYFGRRDCEGFQQLKGKLVG
jgi:hypothetical protein